MRWTRFALPTVLLAATFAFAQDAAPQPKPLIQLAILLDTSNSMDGLIDQARTQLWSVVNVLARTKRHGQTPDFQVALYQYGNDSLNPAEQWVQLVLPFTDDLDKVSEKLFALRTNGGQEYCGAVLESALKQLAWSNTPDAYKVIFIAGNEPFTQGPVNFRGPCEDAKSKGILINTIHCGNEQAGVSGGWRDGAALANGSFLCIDQNQSIAAIPAPQDRELAELSSALNTTYIPYGRHAEENVARQVAADSYAATRASAGAVQLRAAAKSSSFYRNASWDLVDAVKEKKADLSTVKDEDLPENMKSMSVDQRKAYVEEQTKKRGEVQQKIKGLSDARDKFIAEKKREATTQATLEAAMVSTVRQQVVTKQFEVESK
jgi:hypothetical protein